MVDIFSKREGPRLEDVKARRLLTQNAGTIRKLADQISNGGFSKMQARRREPPKPDGLIIHDLKARVTSDVAEPYVKVSLNNRVVLVDRSTGRQMQMLGEIRGSVLSKRFVLASSENGFFSPLDPEMQAALAHLDGVEITDAFSDRDLADRLEDVLVPRDE